jgi:hypothetical protein
MEDRNLGAAGFRPGEAEKKSLDEASDESKG